MGKGNGGTRMSTPSSPKGLSEVAIISNNEEASEVRHDETLMRKRSIKTFDNGGKVERFDKGDYNQRDIKNLKDIASIWAKRTGSEVQILPKVHRKNANYEKLFGELKGTDYEGKCPDLKIITKKGRKTFIEYESYVAPYKGRKLSEMITRGAEQSNSIIIDIRGTNITKKDVIRTINNIKHNKDITVKRVWAYDGKKLRKYWQEK